MHKKFVIAFALLSFQAKAGIEIETDERGQIILTKEICELAEWSLKNKAKDVDETSLWELPAYFKELKTIAGLYKRCIEKGFLER